MKLLFICILMFQHSIQQMQPEVHEYCQRETMNATCGSGHVVMMSSAFYGRMRLGRCIETDFRIGCSLDVLQELDKRCSGRKSCEVDIPDYELHDHAAQPCPRDMFAYLEAAYECVDAFSQSSIPLESCDTEHPIHVAVGSREYIVGKMEKPQCPFRISGKPGQKIRLYLYDFYANGAEAINAEDDMLNDECDNIYATVVDRDTEKDYNICMARERTSVALTSAGHVIDVFIRQAGDIKFMMQFAAIGCADPEPPINGTMHRLNDKVTMTCDHNSVMWHLECRGNEWVGQRKNCSFPPATVQVNLPSNTWVVKGGQKNLHSYGLLVAIFVGITVGALSGFVLLAFVLLCRRAFHKREGCLTQKLNNQPEGCPTYGVLTNQHLTAQQLCAESPYTHIWRLERSSTLPSAMSDMTLPPTPNSCRTLCRCNKHGYITSDSEDYAMSLRSDYVDRRNVELNNEINNERSARTPDGLGSPKQPTANAVTYVSRRNKDYDRVNQVPQLIQDSQGCTVLKNNSLVRIQEEPLLEKAKE